VADWIRNPKHRLKLAWLLLIACFAGWPLSAVTFAKHEPLWVLSLSWLALILTALDIIATVDVRKEQEGA
jgi:uncharacterized membrane protein YfcA